MGVSQQELFSPRISIDPIPARPVDDQQTKILFGYALASRGRVGLRKIPDFFGDRVRKATGSKVI